MNYGRVVAFMCFVWSGLMFDDLDPTCNLAYILGPKLGLMDNDVQEEYFAAVNAVSLLSIMLGSVAAGFVQS